VCPEAENGFQTNNNPQSKGNVFALFGLLSADLSNPAVKTACSSDFEGLDQSFPKPLDVSSFALYPGLLLVGVLGKTV
jgi:hypothetical protein